MQLTTGTGHRRRSRPRRSPAQQLLVPEQAAVGQLAALGAEHPATQATLASLQQWRDELQTADAPPPAPDDVS